MSDILKDALELARRPYTTIVFRDRTTDDDYLYVAVNPELEGCLAQGETAQEAQDNLNAFRIDYIQHLLEHHLPVPEPKRIRTGRITITIPESPTSQDPQAKIGKSDIVQLHTQP